MMTPSNTAPPTPASGGIDNCTNDNVYHENLVPVAAPVAPMDTTDANQCPPQAAIHYPYYASVTSSALPAAAPTLSNSSNPKNANGNGYITSSRPYRGGNAGINISAAAEEQRGHKCCGCCCDVRRAVIIVNGVLIVLAMISIVLYLENVQDEAYPADAIRDDTIPNIYVILALQIGANIIGIIGAVRFNKFMVGVALIPLCYDVFLGITPPESIPAIILALCLIYPHVMLIQEINDGIMSKDTYDREKASCSCAPCVALCPCLCESIFSV